MGGADKTWLSSLGMCLVAVISVIFLAVSCNENSTSSETKRMEACVAEGKTWVLAENRSNVMECK